MVRLSRKLEMIKLTDKRISEMVQYAKNQEDILALYLYGSYGTPDQTPLSDVDLAVLPIRGRLPGNRILEIMSDMMDIGKNEDINTLDLAAVPITLQMRILESGRLLYSRNEILLADFKEYVIIRHSDFAPDMKAINEDFDRGLRGEFFDR